MLLRIVLRDPRHRPENLADFSLKMLGPGVSTYVTGLRRQNSDAAASQLELISSATGLLWYARRVRHRHQEVVS